ncbi:glycosyltransferase family 2 protein [Bacillus sp. B1-b2]|uniref:glycosyltransferase family 2 protein n=1 Tax=Bacillus sp. B1-b2 TaxID=2653201 RepID=UPI001D02A1A5|nr:glycosyltransferase family 2 protein [Bacillus sp. B1-b2]
MKVSVLIPTYNAGTDIIDLLRAIYNQKLKQQNELEVIIIDSSSTDHTVETVKTKFPKTKVIVIPNKEFDHGGTRNALYTLSTGELLLYMTQDAIPADEYLIENLISSFEDEKVMISFARQLPKSDAAPLEVFARNFNYPSVSILKSKEKIKELGIKTFFNSNVCSMYRRSLFTKFKGFREKIILNEDMILASEAILNDYYVYYNAEAKVYHSHNYNLKQQSKRYFDIGMAFQETEHLLSMASNEKEGIKMVFNQIKYLYKNKKISLIPYSIVESGIKFISYNLGKRHTIFPHHIKQKLSAYMK